MSSNVSKVPTVTTTFLIVIIMMGSVAMFATDIYVPALPAMAQHFHCTQWEIQTSFTLFLLGLAVCQLVYGALADYFGRRKVTIFGLSLFMVSSFLCTYADNLTEFLFARILQAIGAGAGSVMVRAIIADKFNRQEAVRIFSTTFPIIGLSAAIAPFIGGYLTLFFDWRASFYFMIFYGLITLLLVTFCLADNERKESVQKFTFNQTLSSYAALFKNLNFIGYVLVISSGFAAFRAYTVESPFVFDNEGYVVHEMGQFYIFLSLTYLVGNMFAKRLVKKMNINNILKVGFLFFVLGGLCMILGSLHIEKTPYAIILPMAVVTFGNGFLFPTGSGAAMTAVPTPVAGMASGLIGALQFIMAAICTNWIGDFCRGHAFSMALFISIIISMGFFSFVLLVARRSKMDTAVS